MIMFIAHPLPHSPGFVLLCYEPVWICDISPKTISSKHHFSNGNFVEQQFDEIWLFEIAIRRNCH